MVSCLVVNDVVKVTMIKWRAPAAVAYIARSSIRKERMRLECQVQEFALTIQS